MSYSYLGKNADGTLGLFDDNTLQNALPGSVTQALNADGSIFSGTDTGFGMDWLNNNAEGLGIVSQLGGLGLAGYDTFFGDTAKINDLKIEGLKQQIANNKQSMVDRKTFNKNWADASNGLAASQVV